jgi:hypothetical protein
MTVYGLSGFLETPESQLKGRKGHITASIVMTALQACGTSLDPTAKDRTPALMSLSERDWLQLVGQNKRKVGRDVRKVRVEK